MWKPSLHPLARLASLAAALTSLAAATAIPEHTVWLEAEGFDAHGGWDLDQQAMDIMGSPYLLAHGLGVPVQDATTRAHIPATTTYHVHVRTRDWVAPWNAPGTPGRFQLVINGKPLPETFGTKGADWHWHPGGAIELPAGETTVALHDLTGFEGRCDAIVLTPDPHWTPPNDVPSLLAARRTALHIPNDPENGGSFDLVVVGGGIAGTATAISAARNGLHVALVHDRHVLGGNGSSEVRVWPEGKTRLEPFPHIGSIVDELVPQKGPADGNAKGASVYADDRKIQAVLNEPRIKLLTGHRVHTVESANQHIHAVIARNTRTNRDLRLAATLFADCTGDATVGFLAGADHEISTDGLMGASNLWNVLDTANPAEVIKCECKDKDAITTAIEQGHTAAPFPRCPWALDLTDKPFPGRRNHNGQWSKNPLANLGAWFWESGYQLDMITDIERIRDHNLRAMYGAWDTLKNVDGLYPNHRLGWAAFIAGKRESRRLLGDVRLTGKDFREKTAFPDACFPCTWSIDLHTPDPRFSSGLPGQEFISRATSGQGYTYKSPFWAPYRCLYSRNIDNLFMAGRNISVDREALGATRVMRTTGMMGEVVGKAAALCIQNQSSPRGIWQNHLPKLINALNQPSSPKPNILLIVGDDMGYADTGFHGCKDIPTPHLDALAASGARFTAGYVSGPYCSPTRAGLLTGRYQTRFGHEFNPGGNQGLPLSETTLANRLKAHGYATGLVGKWHLGASPSHHPQQRGFDEFFGFLGGAHSFFKPKGILRGNTQVPEMDYTTDAFGREATAFIDRHRNQPWFLYLAFNAVHTPMDATPDRLAKFASIADPLRRKYAAMMSAMDDAIGKVLLHLKSTGMEKNTLVMFISDNGGPTMPGTTLNGSSNAPFRGSKRTTLEGGIRVPFLISWPGRIPASAIHHPTLQLDLHATALAAAGIPTPADWKLEGTNLLPLAEGKSNAPPHDALYWRFGNQMAIREGDFKLVRYDPAADNAPGGKRKATPPKLYNLATDPGETTNLASEMPEKAAALQTKWNTWNQQNTPPKWSQQAATAPASNPPD